MAEKDSVNFSTGPGAEKFGDKFVFPKLEPDFSVMKWTPTNGSELRDYAKNLAGHEANDASGEIRSEPDFKKLVRSAAELLENGKATSEEVYSSLADYYIHARTPKAKTQTPATPLIGWKPLNQK